MGPWSRDSCQNLILERERVLAAEAKKAGFASENTHLISRLPCLIEMFFCICYVLEFAVLVSSVCLLVLIMHV